MAKEIILNKTLDRLTQNEKTLLSTRQKAISINFAALYGINNAC
jgi:hypothetical protein